jgi:hypothetical protein
LICEFSLFLNPLEVAFHFHITIMKLELLTFLAFLSLGTGQTAPDPAIVCRFGIRTSVLPGQSAFASRFDNLFLDGARPHSPAATTAVLLVGPAAGKQWCYNGSHIGEPAGPSWADAGLSLPAAGTTSSRWTPLMATSEFAGGSGTSYYGHWKVVPGKSIEWTLSDTNPYGLLFKGFLGMSELPSSFNLILTFPL